MSDREAIERLRLMADGGTNFSGASQTACGMGADALQEREERASGCNFCLSTEYERRKDTDFRYFIFCPKCGRKLKGENNG